MKRKTHFRRRDKLILATRRSEVETAFGSAAVDEHRMRAYRRARGRVIDVFNRRFERCGHAGSVQVHSEVNDRSAVGRPLRAHDKS